MAPIEINPIHSGGVAGRGPARPAGDRQATPPSQVASPGGGGGGRAVVFDANRDGPWPRTRRQLIAKANTLHEVMGEVRQVEAARGPDAPVLPAVEYAYGVASAAYWTLGVLPRTPIGLMDEPVTDAMVRQQASLADGTGRDGLAHGEIVWASYCAGVLAWLSWLVGAENDILWPNL